MASIILAKTPSLRFLLAHPAHFIALGCGSGLSRRPSKKKGQFWWGCSNFPTCKQTYPDLKGRPDYSKGRNGPASE